jgi:hypothetical protein
VGEPRRAPGAPGPRRDGDSGLLHGCSWRAE